MEAFQTKFNIEKIYNIVLQKAKCEISGAGQLECENHIEIETKTKRLLPIDVKPHVSISGKFSNDTIHFLIDDGDNVYSAICVQKTNKLNQFNGKFYDDKKQELGTIKFLEGEFEIKGQGDSEIDESPVDDNNSHQISQNDKTETPNKSLPEEQKITRYRILVGCFSSGNKENDLIEKFKLRESEPFYKSKSPVKKANCLRYMIGNYVNVKEAIDKLYLMRKYDKTCHIAIVSIFNDREEIEVSDKW